MALPGGLHSHLVEEFDSLFLHLQQIRLQTTKFILISSLQSETHNIIHRAIHVHYIHVHVYMYMYVYTLYMYMYIYMYIHVHVHNSLGMGN